jgi:LuxR family maltose regulon positive regulatory protein
MLAGQALDILRPISEAAGAAGRTVAQIETLALQALACQAQADSSQARTTLAQALSLAEPEGFIRLFVIENSRFYASWLPG